MAGPWEDYAPGGPWEDYATASKPSYKQQVQQALEQPASVAPAGTMERFQRGIGNATIDKYLGLKQMLTGLSDEDKQMLAQVKEDKAKGGVAGAVGEMVPSLAELYLPGVKGLGLLGGAGFAAGESALTTPSKGDNLLYERGLEGAKSAGAALALGGALKGTMQMFKPSEDTAKLLAQGVVPTLDRGAESRIGKGIGWLASGSGAGKTRQMQEVAQAMDDVATAKIAGQTLQRAELPSGALAVNKLPSAPASEIGTENAARLAGLDRRIQDVYNGALGNQQFTIAPALKSSALQKATDLMRKDAGNSEASAKAYKSLMEVVGDPSMPYTGTAKELQSNVLTPLQDAIEANIGDKKVVSALVKAREAIQSARDAQIPAKSLLNARNAADDAYYTLSRMKEATQGAESASTGMRAGALAKAYDAAPGGTARPEWNSLVGPASRTFGNGNTTGDLMGMGKRALAAGAGVALTGKLAAVPYAISALGQTRGGARALYGDLAFQKMLAEAMRKNNVGMGVLSPLALGLTEGD